MTRRGPRTGILAADVPDLSHAVMGLAMALMVSPAGPEIPAPLGIAAFTVLAAWFAARLRHDGPLSRAALPTALRADGRGDACDCGPTAAAEPARPGDGELGGDPHTSDGARPGALPRLTDLTSRDRHAAGHGGYHLHHLVGCAAMVVMYLTGHGALAADAIAATAAAGAETAATGAAQDAVALDVHGAHATMPALAALCWAFGLYFLVAATSLGFRVGESSVRRTPAAPTPAGPASARLLTSPAGACATEVALSAGMAVLFFSAP
ncbi:DUF5134 domain-containing protein [Jiangella endophytica]|uniref:DUF5134 domain-containing protein n=1 Tax=Jiangella endophytica TaxID=1623398 RepID=UPI0018E59FF5|nr:DUF5134 domain-containing protein [Jiangella endophytica]